VQKQAIKENKKKNKQKLKQTWCTGVYRLAIALDTTESLREIQTLGGEP